MIHPGEKINEGDWVEGKVWHRGLKRHILAFVDTTVSEYSYCYAFITATFNNSRKKVNYCYDENSCSIILHYSEISPCCIVLERNDLLSLIDLALKTKDKKWFLSLSGALKNMARQNKRILEFSRKEFLEVK